MNECKDECVRCCIFVFVVEVELSDESGQVKHLSDVPFRYASELLQERERLVLLRVERKFYGR